MSVHSWMCDRQPTSCIVTHIPKIPVSYSRVALTHNASKDIPENESPNADPQDDIDPDCDRICHLDEISQNVIPVIQCEELKQSNKCITQ